jgi:peptidoglycan/LPS O-acetylase OafA/YrhL
MTHTRIAVPARNNFDLLRFVFAAVVVLYHARVLSQAPQLAFLGVLSADLAVRAFFVVSGFLVFMSFERSASTRRYFGKRIRRIYPAYFTVVVGAAVLGAFVTELPWSQYFSSGLLRYLAANLVFANFLAPDLPGVFVHNPMTEVNGALWTIKIEVMFYAAVPVLAWLAGRFGRLAVLVVAYAFAIVWAQVFASLAAQTGISLYGRLSYQFPGMLGYFASGALCYYYLPILQKRWTRVAALGIAGLIVARTFVTTQPYLEPAALAAVIVWLALGIRCFGNFARYGDLSYGIYIIHAPVLQTLVAAGVFAASAAGGFALALTLILTLAFACWHLVERPFLQRSSHYVVASRGA